MSKMKTQQEVEAKIQETEKQYGHVLRGSVASLQINGPRALMQVEAETVLRVLHWVLGMKYKSKLKGTDR